MSCVKCARNCVGLEPLLTKEIVYHIYLSNLYNRNIIIEFDFPNAGSQELISFLNRMNAVVPLDYSVRA